MVVTDCRSVRLRPITTEEANMEGVGTAYEFEQIWHQLYDKNPYRRWEKNPPVFRIEFRCMTKKPGRIVPLEVSAPEVPYD